MASITSWLQVFAAMIIVFVILVVIAIFMSSIAQAVNPNAYNTKYPATPQSGHSNNQVSVNAPKEMGLDMWKIRSLAVDYESLARYPEKYSKQQLHVTGEITQVQELLGTYAIHLSTKKQSYGDGYSGDDIWVNFPKSGEARPLEKDIITVYGYGNGLKEYTTVLGASRSIPLIDAKYIVTSGRV